MIEEILKSEYSLDDYEYINIEDHKDAKECPLCKKMFYPEGRNASRQRYCKRTHVINCIICGTPVIQREASEKYGTVKFTCSKKCTDKAKILNSRETMKEKYGVENPSQVPEFREKADASRKVKSAETTRKRVATMEAKYGGMGMASPILRPRIEATNLERYGSTNPAKNEDVQRLISEITSSEEYQKNRSITSMIKWGVDIPSKHPAVIKKMKETCLERYGVECTLQSAESKERLKEVSLAKYGVENSLQSDYAREQARLAIIEKSKNGYHNRVSKVNQKVAETLLNKYGIKTEYEYYLKSDDKHGNFDLHVIDTNTVIEIDPSYTHSTVPSHWENVGKDLDYQLKKTLIAEANSYRCIHIFDWDDPDKIYLLLYPKEHIYARKCSIQKIDKKTSEEFLNLYHVQNNAQGAKYCYGLYYQDELVEVMTFGRPRYNKNYEWELLRLCTVAGKSVIGGASKMFQQFIKDADPTSILSYCDRAKFTGRVYQKMGMKLHHVSEPAKVWSKGTEYITDNFLRQRGYDQIFGTSYGKGTSNELLMIEHGWLPVYDCGQFVFEWIK